MLNTMDSFAMHKVEVQDIPNYIREVSKEYVPVDRLVPLYKSSFSINEGQRFVQSTSGTFTLEKDSYTQLLRLLHPKAELTFLTNLSDNVEEQVVNDLIKRFAPRKDLLFRTRKDTPLHTFAVLTREYTPVNHYDLFNQVARIMEKNSGTLGRVNVSPMFTCNQKFSAFRLPLVKLSDKNKGIYAGIEFTNGQDGKKKLVVRGLIFELICTNGMVGTTSEFTFINHVHRGRIPYLDSVSIEHWFNEKVIDLKRIYDELDSTVVPNAEEFITDKLVKKYSMLTAELSASMLEYLKITDKMVNGSAKAFDILSSITYLSQQYKDRRRFELDELSFDIARKEWL